MVKTVNDMIRAILDINNPELTQRLVVEVTDKLGFEQRKSIPYLFAHPDIEGALLCSTVDMSWDDLSMLAALSILDVGSERLEKQRMHPQLTDFGKLCCEYIMKMEDAQ